MVTLRPTAMEWFNGLTTEERKAYLAWCDGHDLPVDVCRYLFRTLTDKCVAADPSLEDRWADFCRRLDAAEAARQEER